MMDKRYKGKPATNEEVIRRLPTEELAKLLIKTDSEPDYDENFDGEMTYCGDEVFYVTSDGEQWGKDYYYDALQHECWWLKQAVGDGVIDETEKEK